jgi:hypothetical protein
MGQEYYLYLEWWVRKHEQALDTNFSRKIWLDNTTNRPTRRWGNIKIDYKEVWHEVVDYVQVVSIVTSGMFL